MDTATQTPLSIAPDERDESQNNSNNEATRQLLRKWRTEETRDEEMALIDVQQLIEENRLSARQRFGE